VLKSLTMTSPARRLWQTPDEVLEALREEGVPLRAYGAGAAGGGGDAEPIGRSTESIARFMKLGGGACLVAKLEGGELPAPDAVAAVVATLPGG
jgi:hypothetical protein